jgi:hypothetical protein
VLPLEAVAETVYDQAAFRRGAEQHTVLDHAKRATATAPT